LKGDGIELFDKKALEKGLSSLKTPSKTIPFDSGEYSVVEASLNDTKREHTIKIESTGTQKPTKYLLNAPDRDSCESWINGIRCLLALLSVNRQQRKSSVDPNGQDEGAVMQQLGKHIVFSILIILENLTKGTDCSVEEYLQLKDIGAATSTVLEGLRILSVKCNNNSRTKLIEQLKRLKDTIYTFQITFPRSKMSKNITNVLLLIDNALRKADAANEEQTLQQQQQNGSPQQSGSPLQKQNSKENVPTTIRLRKASDAADFPMVTTRHNTFFNQMRNPLSRLNSMLEYEPQQNTAQEEIMDAAKTLIIAAKDLFTNIFSTDTAQLAQITKVAVSSAVKVKTLSDSIKCAHEKHGQVASQLGDMVIKIGNISKEIIRIQHILNEEPEDPFNQSTESLSDSGSVTSSASDYYKPPSRSPSDPAIKGLTPYKAKFSYKCRNLTFSSGDVELEFKTKDIMYLIEPATNGWLKVTMNGKIGLAPSNYIYPLDGSPPPYVGPSAIPSPQNSPDVGRVSRQSSANSVTQALENAGEKNKDPSDNLIIADAMKKREALTAELDKLCTEALPVLVRNLIQETQIATQHAIMEKKLKNSIIAAIGKIAELETLAESWMIIFNERTQPRTAPQEGEEESQPAAPVQVVDAELAERGKKFFADLILNANNITNTCEKLLELLQNKSKSQLFELSKTLAGALSGFSMAADEVSAVLFLKIEVDETDDDETMSAEREQLFREALKNVRDTAVVFLKIGKSIILNDFKVQKELLDLTDVCFTFADYMHQSVHLINYYINTRLKALKSKDSKTRNLTKTMSATWEDEPDDTDHIILEFAEDNTSVVKAATLNKLIQRLTSDIYSDVKFQKQFLCTYRSFVTPQELFAVLVQRYNVRIPKLPRGVSLDEFQQKYVKPIQVRVANVIKNWVDTSYFDIDKKLLAQITRFVDNKLIEDGHETVSKQIKSAIAKKQSYRETRKGTWSIKVDIVRSDLPSSEIIVQFDEEAIAKQLCLVDSDIYHSIRPVELMNQSWNKSSLKHRAVNVLRMIERFNQVSNWVALSILYQEKLQQRVKIYEKFISLLDHLRKLNNFNSLLAVMSGLNNSAVFRLQFTRDEISSKSKKLFEEYMELMNNKNSYKNYREALHTVNPPCVPYLGVYLTDLTFIEDGNKDVLNNLINFRKRALISEIVSEIQLYQQLDYPFEMTGQLFHLLLTLPTNVSNDELYQLSLLREPRNAEYADIL